MCRGGASKPDVLPDISGGGAGEADEPELRPQAEDILRLVNRLAADFGATECDELAGLLERVRKRTGL